MIRPAIIHAFALALLGLAERARLTGQRFGLEDLDDIAEYLNRSCYRLQK